MTFIKRIASGAYALAAIIIVIAGFIGFWMLLVSTDVAIVPLAGSTIPISVPIPKERQVRTVHLDGRPLNVTIADTPAAQESGLGGKSGLSPDEGMLFVFPKDGEYGFWMKDMRFAIDIIWLSADGTVVYIEKNVSPSTYPDVFKPREVARYVLELPAGYTDVYTVRPGSRLQF